MNKFAQMILDNANKYGPSKTVNKTIKPICSQTDTSVKNQLQDAQTVTKRATPNA